MSEMTWRWCQLLLVEVAGAAALHKFHNQCFDESGKLLSATGMDTKILKMLSKILMAGMQLGETWPDIRQTTLHVPETSYKKDLLRNSIVH